MLIVYDEKYNRELKRNKFISKPFIVKMKGLEKQELDITIN